MTDSHKESYEQEQAAKRAELVGQLTGLVDEGKEQEVEDLLYNQQKHGDLPFSMSGQTIGLNYNVDEYFVHLPNGKVINYGIGGRESTYIEHVTIMSEEEAGQKQKVMDLTDEANKLASKAVNDGSPQDRKLALGSIRDLEQQVGLIKDWLKERVEADKTGK